MPGHNKRQGDKNETLGASATYRPSEEAYNCLGNNYIQSF